MSADASLAFIQDATDENFDELVVANSSRGPVLVNYWSKKVGPCIRQYPVLEQLAKSYAGRFLLVNLNTDEHRMLAKTYGVTSLPTIKLFLQGKVVETRHGYQDEADLQYLLAKYMPRESDRALTEAVKVYQQGDAEQAMKMLAQAIIEDPRNIRLPLTMARLMVSEGDSEEAERLLDNMPPEQRDDAQARLLRGEIALIRVSEQALEPDLLLAKASSDEHALEPRYQLAAHYFVAGNHAEAMRMLFEVLQADRQFQQGAAHRALMTLFAVLGDEDERVQDYRSRLQHLFN